MSANVLCLFLPHDSFISSSFTLHFSKCLCFRRLVFYLLILKRKKIWKSQELLTERKSQWIILLHRHIVSRHRVDQVLSFLSSRPNWIGTPPTPSHAGECVPPHPPLVPGEAHSLAGERVECFNSNEGTDTVYVLCVWKTNTLWRP